MEKDTNTYDDELEVEEVDDTDEDDGDIEEYDFNDEDYEEDGKDEDVEDGEDAEDDGEADEAEETVSEESEESEETVPEKVEEKPEELTAEQKRELTLLHKLGYEGDYKTAVAEFEKDSAKGTEPEGVKGDGKAAETPAVDYEARAKAALEEINAELGLELKDFSSFEDLEAFAELSLKENVGAVKAFKATNPKLMEQIAMKAAMAKLSAPKRSVPTLPKADGGKGGTARGETISAAKIAEYKALFPYMSRADIIKLHQRTNRNTR